jgi:acyl-CoA synthetase (AMP-forming)/AMP-acid ligase II
LDSNGARLVHILENIGSIYELETSSYVTGVEIKSRVSQKTKYMIENGISCGSRVVITIENSVEFFVNLFSLWAIGAVAIPISEKSTNSEIDSVTKGLFAIAKITVTGLNLLKSDEAKKSKDTGFQPDKPCLILMSSGTTGVSKGIEFSFLQILNKMNTFNLRYGNAYERTLCFLPTSFGHGLIANCLTPLLNGKDLFLSKRFNFQIALSLEEILIHHKISLFSTVPSMWNLIQKAQVPPPAKLFLSQVHCASAFLHKNTYDFIRSWIGNTSFYYHYGLTECGSWITEAQLPIDCDLYKFGYVGKPLDCEILVKNQDQSGSGQVVTISSENWRNQRNF